MENLSPVTWNFPIGARRLDVCQMGTSGTIIAFWTTPARPFAAALMLRIPYVYGVGFYPNFLAASNFR